MLVAYLVYPTLLIMCNSMELEWVSILLEWLLPAQIPHPNHHYLLLIPKITQCGSINFSHKKMDSNETFVKKHLKHFANHSSSGRQLIATLAYGLEDVKYVEPYVEACKQQLSFIPSKSCIMKQHIGLTVKQIERLFKIVEKRMEFEFAMKDALNMAFEQQYNPSAVPDAIPSSSSSEQENNSEVASSSEQQQQQPVEQNKAL